MVLALLKRKRPVHPASMPMYQPLTGCNYLEMLERLHKELAPDWYLEIGVHFGNSLKFSKAKTIGVDPFFDIHTGQFPKARQIHLFQTTSDDFFTTFQDSLAVEKIDFAFLDGMHQFEFLLRDFINTEKLCKVDSVIALHDCIPISENAALRHWDKSITKSWTGDVWKLVPILRKYRPDLQVSVLDCPPSGMTIVQNLDSNNTVLETHYDEIVANFLNETIISYGKDRLWAELIVLSSQEFSLT